jgi:hypothetical protein
VFGELDHTLEFSMDSQIETGTTNHTQSGISLTSGSETLVPRSDVVDAIYTTDTVQLPVGQPIGIDFSLDLAGFGNPGSFDDEFGDTVELPSGIPVFTLPGTRMSTRPCAQKQHCSVHVRPFGARCETSEQGNL